jgi:hypothetical protein
LVVLLVTGVLGVPATPAGAEATSPWWHVNVGSRPTVLAPDGKGTVVVAVTNLGDGVVDGESTPVVVTDTLPTGVKATSAYYSPGAHQRFGTPFAPSACVVSGSQVRCEFAGLLPSYEELELVIYVTTKKDELPVGKLTDDVGVTGGGAPSVSTSGALTVGEGPEPVTPFGVETFEMVPENAEGAPATQAGSHPFQLTTTLVLNAGAETFYGMPVEELRGVIGFVAQPALPRNLRFELPPGMVGNPSPFPRCTEGQFIKEECPVGAQLGVAIVTLASPVFTTESRPVFNMVPATGEPARFGYDDDGVLVFLDTSVRSGKDYGVTVNANNITQTATFLSTQVSFWGWPGDPRHDPSRGYGCVGDLTEACPEDTVKAPFLSLPTSCGNAPFATSMEGDSWPGPNKPQAKQAPLTYTLHNALDPSIGMDGCNALAFEPSVKVTPDVTSGSSPSGLNVDVHVPQQEVLNPNGDAQATVRNITVALPEGVAVNPAGGDGLQACSEGLVGFTGVAEIGPGLSAQTFTPALPNPLAQGVNFCPDASKIGEVTIHTPLLPNPLKGFVYLASQNENPFGSLVAMYIVAEDPVSGVLVKLPGEVRLSETGQIVTYVKNSPQLPFEDAELHFFGGERAPLATPAHCGSYETKASFTPWSAEPGESPHGSASAFDITSGPNGAPCPGASLPFGPSLTGGAINNNGGAFSPLSTTIGREDGQQNMSAVTLHMPPGLSGLLSGVELCPEANANAGSCGPGSLIGETTVSAGVGSDPVSVKGGRVYITGPYHGAPFGLSIVNPVKAGPFDLEHDTSNPNQNPACDCVVVRAKIEVDPHTAALTVTTNNENEGYAIPHLIDGIPVQIKKVNVLIDRSGFTFNPTSCDPMQITGSIGSDEGASSPVSVPFQVANCAVLQFAPKFSVSTSGKTSKANGASLTAKVSEPNASFGSQANIARVKVDLPKQLPSRLTTLQKACTAAQFETNPAGCPQASFIGHAVVRTPLVPVPLEGPAIFVSHGGEAFPSLIMVLQGYGVTVDLVGTTFISKAGITSSTFKTVPDVPFSTFELTLPEGRFSALTANGNLCTSKLQMPTEFLAQNGMKINESTKIAVTGCAKTKALTRAQKLAKALKACHKDRSKAKRASCEHAARRKYGSLKKKK